jgi:hypothetical protein
VGNVVKDYKGFFKIEEKKIKEVYNMAFLMRQGTRYDYEYKEYIIDDEKELETIDVNHCCPGSIVLVTSNLKVFILKEEGIWQEV